MPIQGCRVKLCQAEYFIDTTVNTITDWNINQTITGT